MSKAEKRALEALDMYAPKGVNEQVGLVYTKSAMLGMFKDGYHQAEKDLELTWEDIRRIYQIVNSTINDVDMNNLTDKSIYQEVLKRFKDFKEKKEK